MNPCSLCLLAFYVAASNTCQTLHGGSGRRRLLADPVKLGHVIERERACMNRLEDLGILRMAL